VPSARLFGGKGGGEIETKILGERGKRGREAEKKLNKDVLIWGRGVKKKGGEKGFPYRLGDGPEMAKNQTSLDNL